MEYMEARMQDRYEAVMRDDDGWIDWRGGECPVDEGAVVEVRMSGEQRDDDEWPDGGAYRAYELIWHWASPTVRNRIMAYRIIG